MKTDIHAECAKHPAMVNHTTPPRRLMTVDREAFRYRLAYIVERSGLSKTDFARSIGITKSNFSQALQGNRMLTVDQIYNLMIVHGVPMEYLLTGSEANLPDRFRN